MILYGMNCIDPGSGPFWLITDKKKDGIRLCVWNHEWGNEHTVAKHGIRDDRPDRGHKIIENILVVNTLIMQLKTKIKAATRKNYPEGYNGPSGWTEFELDDEIYGELLK